MIGKKFHYYTVTGGAGAELGGDNWIFIYGCFIKKI
jgi:hypothetical protein